MESKMTEKAIEEMINKAIELREQGKLEEAKKSCKSLCQPIRIVLLHMDSWERFYLIWVTYQRHENPLVKLSNCHQNLKELLLGYFFTI